MLCAGLVFFLSPMLVFPPGLGCCVRLFELVSGLVSQLVFHLVFQLVWDAVAVSLVLSPSWYSILSFTGKAETKKQKFKLHVRFLQLFGVYGGGVGLLNLGTYGMIMRLQVFVTSMCLLKVELKCLTRYFSCFLTFNET